MFLSLLVYLCCSAVAGVLAGLLGVGGGITSESDLEFEYEETLQKAKAVLEALQ